MLHWYTIKKLSKAATAKSEQQFAANAIIVYAVDNNATCNGRRGGGKLIGGALVQFRLEAIVIGDVSHRVADSIRSYVGVVTFYVRIARVECYRLEVAGFCTGYTVTCFKPQ